MKVKCICKQCKVLNIEKNENNGIEWYSAVFMQGNEVNSNITVDKNIAPELKPMQTYDLILTVTENPKAYRNGTGAYIESKFKITGVDGKKDSVAKA